MKSPVILLQHNMTYLQWEFGQGVHLLGPAQDIIHAHAQDP
jgi:hypothetical protein